MRLLITDLDNTLYDWVTYFARAFDAMVRRLVTQLGVPRERLLDEFHALHQRYGSPEHPFAALDLPSVRERFPTLGRAALAERLAPSLAAFGGVRKKHLRLYEGVEPALRRLGEAGIPVVAHTEAVAVNAWDRLQWLGIGDCFTRLYALEGHVVDHPWPDRVAALPEILQVVPRAERKPNPQLLLDICRREGVSPSEAVYVGDSLTRDIAMAKAAGVAAAWARYGTLYDKRLWQVVVRVSHWTDEDITREVALRRRAEHVAPDHVFARFAEVLPLAGLSVRRRAVARRRVVRR